MQRPPNVPGCIGLPPVSTSPNGNTWNTTNDPSVIGNFGVSRSVDAAMYNGYNMAPLYLGVVTNSNMLFTQQPLVTTMGRQIYNYSNQNSYSQPYILQNQTTYP